MAIEEAMACSSDQHIVEQGPEEEPSALFESDSFRMYCYKVLPCAKRASHEWTTCPWAHPGERARRRDPRVYPYLAIPCPDTKEGKDCPRGDDCPNCHSLFEYWLHPSRYRTQLCRNSDGSHCKRQICFFAHSIEELRVPDHSHLNIPDEMRQQSNSTAGVSATAAASSSTSSTPKQTGSSPCISPKSGQSSSHKACKDHKHSCASKAPGKVAGGSKSKGGLATSDSLSSSLELPTTTTPSGTAPVNCITRYPSGQVQLPPSEQQAMTHQSPAHGEMLCRSTSIDAAHPAAGMQGRHSPAGPAVSSALFGSGMMGDPEVGEAMQSPQALAIMQQHHQQMMQMQKDQYEASLSAAAVAYEQQQTLSQQLMAQQQQQQAAVMLASSRGYGGTPAGYGGDYASPPLSPSATSMLSSVAPEDTCSSCFTSLGSGSSYVSAYGSSMGPGMTWQAPLPRALSGPCGYSANACYTQSPAFRYQSVDSAAASAAAAAAQMPASAADYAPARIQMELMRSPEGQAMAEAAANMGAPMYSGIPPSSQQLRQQAYMQQQQQQKAAVSEQQLNLADVAELVDSVNRGELGECGSQVLTGVIGLLMQKLQQQQLSA